MHHVAIDTLRGVRDIRLREKGRGVIVADGEGAAGVRFGPLRTASDASVVRTHIGPLTPKS